LIDMISFKINRAGAEIDIAVDNDGVYSQISSKSISARGVNRYGRSLADMPRAHPLQKRFIVEGDGRTRLFASDQRILQDLHLRFVFLK